MRPVGFEEGGEAGGGELVVVPTEKLEFLYAARVDASGTGEITGVRGVDVESERAGEEDIAARQEVIFGEAQVEDLQGERLGGDSGGKLLAQTFQEARLGGVEELQKSWERHGGANGVLDGLQDGFDTRAGRIPPGWRK